MASSFLNTIHQSNYNNLKVNLNCVYVSIVRTHEYCFIWPKEPCKDGLAKMDTVAHTWNLSIWEGKKGSSQVWSYVGCKIWPYLRRNKMSRETGQMWWNWRSWNGAIILNYPGRIHVIIMAIIRRLQEKSWRRGNDDGSGYEWCVLNMGKWAISQILHTTVGSYKSQGTRFSSQNF